MAREAKRKRDARRFGEPRTLIDRIVGGGFHAPSWVPVDADRERRFAEFGAMMGRSRVVKADNVYRLMAAAVEMDVGFGQFPCVRPPFPLLWVDVETDGLTAVVVDSDGEAETVPRRFGWLLHAVDRDYFGVHGTTDVFDDLCRLGGQEPSAVPTAVVGWLAVQYDDAPRTLFPLCDVSFLCGPDGRLLAPPRQQAYCHRHAVLDPEFPRDGLMTLCTFALSVALKTLCFLNCRGVTTAAHDPDRAQDRVRRRHGLKPFVRYHTIRVDPSLVRAARGPVGPAAGDALTGLHIVRGNFARYSEDKPLFGRADMHGLFWRPSHVRGETSRGVVVSDYEVCPTPRGGSDGGL